MKKILYLQFTDPGGYPPIIHSSKILAEQGWRVLVLGTYAFEGRAFDLSAHENISVKRIRYIENRIIRKFQYSIYLCWSILWVMRFRPSWIYASEYLSASAALFLRTLLKVKVIYHEHDCVFKTSQHSFWMRVCLKFRDKLAAQAEIVVLPNQERIKLFKQKLKLKTDPICVWNCASITEVGAEPHSGSDGQLRLIYCGSINQVRLPMKILDAMRAMNGQVNLSVIGYETVGSVGYVNQFRDYAEKLKLSDQFLYLGGKNRDLMLREVQFYDLGLSFMPKKSSDINMRYMAGASNKPFDYLSQGIGVIVSNLPEWEELYVDAGYAISCDCDSIDSMVAAFSYCLLHKEEVRMMGENGRTRVKSEWNYEHQFQPVLRKMNAV